MPTGINPERLKGIPLPKAALALTPLTIGVLSACSNNPALAKLPEGVTPIATDTATAIIPMTPAHAPSIIPASPAITVEVSPLPPSKATETITTTVPVITPTVGTPLPLSGTPFAVPSATETIKPTTTVTKTVVPTSTHEAPVAPTKSPEEIQKEAHELSIKLTTGEYAAVPADLDPVRREIIRAAIEQALIMAPYGVTADELNKFAIKYSGQDFREYINSTYGKFGINFDQIMAGLPIRNPSDIFNGITINTNHYSSAITAWEPDRSIIYVAPRFRDNINFFTDALFKEAIANHVSDYATSIRQQKIDEATSQGKPVPPPSKVISGNNQGALGESVSFLIEGYMLQHWVDTGHILPAGSDSPANCIKYAFAGGFHSKLLK